MGLEENIRGINGAPKKTTKILKNTKKFFKYKVLMGYFKNKCISNNATWKRSKGKRKLVVMEWRSG